MFKRHVYVLLVGVLLILLASCGGSSGGKGGRTTSAPGPAQLPITEANAQDITAGVLESITSSVEILDILDVLGFPVVSSTVPGPGQALVADIFTQVIPCDAGQITATWNDADNNLAISTGDSFDMVFETCLFVDTATTLDGATSLTNIIVTGDPFTQIAPWGWSASFGFDGLTGTDSAGTTTLNGGLDFSANSDDNVVVNLSVATASLTVQQGSISESLSNYLLTRTIDLNSLTEVISARGTFTSTVLDGSVTFETLADFVIIGDDNPSAGQMLISDGNSSVLVTVLDNISVQLDIDEDLNGTIDGTLVVPWAELDIE